MAAEKKKKKKQSHTGGSRLQPFIFTLIIILRLGKPWKCPETISQFPECRLSHCVGFSHFQDGNSCWKRPFLVGVNVKHARANDACGRWSPRLKKKTPCVGETVRGNLWAGSHKEETVCTAGALFLAPSQRRQPLPPLVRNELWPLGARAHSER